MDLQIFAHIERDIFKQTIIDTVEVLENLNAAEHYMTLFEVIESHLHPLNQN